MREIEFRGKRIDNGEWIYGCCGYGFTQTVEYIMPDMFFATRDFGEIDKQGNPKIENEIAIGGYFAVDPKTVGQFTGLLDKNGKKIFEGDIIEEGVVYFDDEYLGFFVKGDFVEGEHKPLYDIPLPEIIGNVTDNPELLK